MEQLVRPNDDRFIAGVCSGIAEHFDQDPTLVRLLWVLVTVAAAGPMAVLAYLVMWAIVPDEDGQKASLPVVLVLLVFGLPVACALFFGLLAAAIAIPAAIFG
jgi:phage shock protein C